MDNYKILHKYFNSLERHYFPFDPKKLSQNGIYILFEKGERFVNMDRIVRVGSHKGRNRLVKRLGDHFISENQRSSVFRKHIGRCYLIKSNDSYLKYWNLPFKKIIDKEKNKSFVNLVYEKSYENRITEYIRQNLSFCLIPELTYIKNRSRLEEGLIASIAQSKSRISSKEWLGTIHPNPIITTSKLWNVEYVRGTPLNDKELYELTKYGS